MIYRVLARIGFVDGSCMDVPFDVQATDENDLKRRVTPEFVTTVNDDWGIPISNVTIINTETLGS